MIDVVDEMLVDVVSVEEQVIIVVFVVRIVVEVGGLSEFDCEIFWLCVVEGYVYQVVVEEFGVIYVVVWNCFL